MRKATSILAAAALGTLLSGCGAGGLLNRERPDEFAVQRQTPLVVPPDFQLRPPQPGTPRPTEGTAAQQALEALFGAQAPRSAVETSALRRAGSAEPGIRSTVGDVATAAVDKGEATRTMLVAPEGDGQDASVTAS